VLGYIAKIFGKKDDESWCWWGAKCLTMYLALFSCVQPAVGEKIKIEDDGGVEIFPGGASETIGGWPRPCDPYNHKVIVDPKADLDFDPSIVHQGVCLVPVFETEETGEKYITGVKAVDICEGGKEVEGVYLKNIKIAKIRDVNSITGKLRGALFDYTDDDDIMLGNKKGYKIPRGTKIPGSGFGCKKRCRTLNRSQRWSRDSHIMTCLGVFSPEEGSIHEWYKFKLGKDVEEIRDEVQVPSEAQARSEL